MTTTVFGGASNTDCRDTTDYFPIGPSNNAETTEANVQAAFNVAGTLSLMAIVMDTHTNDAGGATMKTRIAGADGSTSISITANTVGQFRDLTNSDAVTAGQKINLKTSQDNLSHVIYGGWLAKFNAAGQLFSATTSGTHSTTSVTEYFPLFGSLSPSGGGFATTESDVQYKMRTAGVASRLGMRFRSNSNSGITVKSRVNTANGSQSISIAASTAGYFEDATNTDTLASGDLINISIAFGTGNCAGAIAAMTFAPSGSTFEMSTGGSCTLSITQDQYLAVTGFNFLTTTESLRKVDAPIALTLSKLRCYLISNSSNGATLRSRKNGSNGNQAVSITASTSGWFEDVTNSDSVAVNDDINYITNHPTSGTATIRFIGMMADGAILNNYVLTAAAGAYVIAGSAAGLRAARTIVPATGAYVITGNAAFLGGVRHMSCDTGHYVISGAAAGLSPARTLFAATGHYVISGAAAGMRATRRLSPATGHYVVAGSDAGSAFNFTLVSSFSEFRNATFLDWGTTDYTSHMQLTFTIPDNMTWSQTPWVYTFMGQSENSDETSDGAIMRMDWNYATESVSPNPKVTRDTQLYKFHNGYLVTATKHKMRGKGRAIDIVFESETGKNFKLLGWGVWVMTNNQP